VARDRFGQQAAGEGDSADSEQDHSDHTDFLT
jgi:hypothetical protein